MSLQSVQQECFDAANDEYLQEARDDLALFEVLLGNLRTGGSAAEEALPRMVGEVRKLLGLCTGMGLPLLDLLLRRLDNYLTDLDDPNPRQVDDLDVFVDIMRGLLENEVDDNVDEAEFVRSLPVRRPVELEDLEHLNIEILLVDPNRTSARIIARDLQNCGYRVAMAQSSFDAIELAVRTRPDIVLSSSVLDDIAGVDLAAALAVLPKTKSVPFVLVTSYEPGHPSLAGLPESAAVVRKSSQFGDDLAVALERFGII